MKKQIIFNIPAKIMMKQEFSQKNPIFFLNTIKKVNNLVDPAHGLWI